MLRFARASSLLTCLSLCACDSGEAKPKVEPSEEAPKGPVTESEAKGTPKAKPAEAATDAPTASCMGVLATLITKEPEVNLTLEVDGAGVPISFEPNAVYASNPVWDAGDAPSMCAAVVQPPQVERPALTLVTQLAVGGSPAVRLQLTGMEMGEKDFAGSGPGMFTGYYQPADAAPDVKPEALNFTKGKVTLAKAEGGAKSRVTLTFDGAGGELVPSGKVFTVDGTITATVGGR